MKQFYRIEVWGEGRINQQYYVGMSSTLAATLADLHDLLDGVLRGPRRSRSRARLVRQLVWLGLQQLGVRIPRFEQHELEQLIEDYAEMKRLEEVK